MSLAALAFTADLAFASGMAKAAGLGGAFTHAARRAGAHSAASHARAERLGQAAYARTRRNYRLGTAASIVAPSALMAGLMAHQTSKSLDRKKKPVSKAQRRRMIRGAAIAGGVAGAALGANFAPMISDHGPYAAGRAQARAYTKQISKGLERRERYGRNVTRMQKKHQSRTPKPVFSTPEHFWTQVPEHVRGKAKALAHHIWRTEQPTSRYMAEHSLKRLARDHGFDAQRIIAYHGQGLPHRHHQS